MVKSLRIICAVCLLFASQIITAQVRLTDAQLPDIGQDQLVGRVTAGTGSQEKLSATQVRSLLNVIEGGISNVADDLTPQLGSDLDMNSKAFTGIYTASVALVNGDYCFLNASGEMAKVDADAEATTKGMLAMATGNISASSTGTFVLMGNYTTTSLTTGSTYYVSTTLGGITATAPSATGDQVRVVGHATSTTNLFINPSQTWIEIQ